MSPPLLRVGTDCSGIEAPIQALRALGVPHRHVFASDINRHCVRSIRANYAPEVLYGDPDSATPDGDVTRRDQARTPACDLYVAGFPCQPFSIQGARRGLDDARGTVFAGCVAYIQAQRPAMFVLENVKHLRTVQGGAAFEAILAALRALPGYRVAWKILNTKDYGIPQSRNRLFLVGLRDAAADFVFPPPTPLALTPEDLVDRTDATPSVGARADACRAIVAVLAARDAPGVFFDQLHLQYSKPDPILKGGYPYVPCLLCNEYLWCAPMDRRANHRELLRMQGFPDDFRVAVSSTQLRRQIGNAMSVNVLAALFAQLLGLPFQWPAEG